MTDSTESTVLAPRRASSRWEWFVIILFVVAFAVCSWIYRGNAAVINVLVACGPFAFSIALAFVPDLGKAHIIWRITIITIGIILSFAVWQQQKQSASEQADAIANALREANTHSDNQLEAKLSKFASTIADAVVLKISPNKTEGTIRVPSIKEQAAAPKPSAKSKPVASAQPAASVPQDNSYQPTANITAQLQDIKKLLTDKSSWNLTSEQQKVVIDRMRPFANHNPRGDFITCILGDPDSTKLAVTLVTIFRSAGWNLPGSGFNQAIYSGSPVGIRLQLNSPTATPPGLAELVATLREFGIEPTGELDGKVPPDEFRIVVGRKPE